MKDTMIGYIKDQPRMLNYIYNSRRIITQDIVNIFSQNNFKKLYLIGAGTSNFTSMAFKYYVEKYLPFDAVVSLPAVFENYETINKSGVYKKEEILIIGFSQTGTSNSTIRALKKAREEGYKTAVLTAVKESAITEYCDHVLPLLCGTEKVPPETRGFTSAVLSIYLWTLELAKEMCTINEKEYENKISELNYFVKNTENYLEECFTWYEKNKKELLNVRKGFVIGYGLNYVTSLEGNMKLSETYGQPTIAYELEEFIHGPNMAVNKDHYLFMIVSDEKERARFDTILDSFNHVTEHVFLIGDDEMEYNGKEMRFREKCSADLSILRNVMVFQVYAALACQDTGIDTSVFPARLKRIAHKQG